MIRYLLVLILLVSCASLKKNQLESFKSLPGYTEKNISVVSKDEAKKVINNKTNFLKMIFEQSKDPYFGTLRWSEYCLNINKIGDVVESSKGIQSISSLILDKNGEPGFCNDHPSQVRSRLILIYCEGMKSVTEIKYNDSQNSQPLSVDLCD